MVSPETLRRFNFFDGLSMDQLRGIAVISHLLSFEAGQMILQEGEPADRLYLVASGRVNIFVCVGPDKQKRIDITTIGVGDILGWSAVVTESRAASAEAATNSVLIAIDGGALKELFELDRDLAYKITWRIADVLSNRLSRMSYRLASFFET